MRSGTRFRLTLVDRNGREISAQAGEEETAAEYVAPSGAGREEESGSPGERASRNQLLVFAAVSAGCAVVALVTGSYALWLSRRRIADEALTSVHDLLKTCQDRVFQIEQELSHLPPRQPSPTGAASH